MIADKRAKGKNGIGIRKRGHNQSSVTAMHRGATGLAFLFADYRAVGGGDNRPRE